MRAKRIVPLEDGHELLHRLLEASVQRKASDLHLSAGQPPHFRQEGKLAVAEDWPVFDDATLEQIATELAQRTNSQAPPQIGSLDGAMSGQDGTRFRFNVYRRSGAFSIALRRLEDRIRTLPELGLPSELYSLTDYSHGLVLIAGPTGSGKTTTLATLIDRINQVRACHVITIEDPIEYLHRSQKALVDQREVGQDTNSFNEALVASLRQDPDVILVGEIRDLNTIRTAITAAETGHLVFATVHSADCIGSIERLVSVFHVDEQPAIRRQLAMVLRAVVAQRLVIADGTSMQQELKETDDPTAATTRLVLASETMKVNNPVANLISQAKDVHIYSIMETGRADGMYTADECLAQLLREGMISERTARGLARNPQVMLSRASRLRPARVVLSHTDRAS
ncbi:MAG: PilT/PilU family type 4a pilus ATPase [Pirellulaceae bacterium]|nr:PilT/PilU family type 4a pilus ATPase [Pirellulaceae bacterium]